MDDYMKSCRYCKNLVNDHCVADNFYVSWEFTNSEADDVLFETEFTVCINDPSSFCCNKFR